MGSGVVEPVHLKIAVLRCYLGKNTAFLQRALWSRSLQVVNVVVVVVVVDVVVVVAADDDVVVAAVVVVVAVSLLVVHTTA